VGFQTFGLLSSWVAKPVEPKPPSPRWVEGNSVTSTTGGVAIFSKISCAILSPADTVFFLNVNDL